MSGPAAAEPIGPPTMFSAIETANTRPNLAGSVLRCRSVNSATSNGPLTNPIANIASATTITELASGKKAIDIAQPSTETTISCLSRPAIRIRPVSNAETIPAAPINPSR